LLIYGGELAVSTGFTVLLETWHIGATVGIGQFPAREAPNQAAEEILSHLKTFARP
jgi:hypothetical protein